MDTAERAELDAGRPTYRVHLCLGPNCAGRGSHALLLALETAIAREGLRDEIEVLATGCRNRCDYGPSLNVYPGPFFYNEVTPEAIDDIVREHLVGGRPVERWLFRPRLVVKRGGRGSAPERPWRA
jgi:NADP-reducing hydrogenase subunit HndC